MTIRNFFRSVAAELGLRGVTPQTKEGWGGLIGDGGTLVVEPEVETNLASISRNSNGRYVLRVGKTIVNDYANRAGARRGAERRGLSVAS